VEFMLLNCCFLCCGFFYHYLFLPHDHDHDDRSTTRSRQRRPLINCQRTEYEEKFEEAEGRQAIQWPSKSKIRKLQYYDIK
jgi:hypothetical protein